HPAAPRSGSAPAQCPLHALYTLFQHCPWAAEVQADELLAVITKFDPRTQPDLGLLQEERMWVVQAQGAAIEPGQEGALRRMHDHAGQSAAHGIEQVVAVALQVLKQRRQPFTALAVGSTGGFQPQG